MNKSSSINLESLSAKELFDLANKKLQLEQTQARTAELARKREQLLRTHEQALAEFDRKLLALQKQREQLSASQAEEIATLDREIAEASRLTTTAAAAPAPVSKPPPGLSPELSAPAPAPIIPEPKPDSAAPAARGPSDDEFTAAIIDAMKGRSDISDSLLREKLRLKGFQVSNLGKQLEKLVREGVVNSKGGGNYALKKRA